jgi:D-glycero-alpha-D-manno-heptose 1-phosphate guanylyltransferase
MREAIVLAGGFGTRLRSIVPDLPKPMAPVAGRPFLEILLTMLAEKGFSRTVLSVGFMSENIIKHFGKTYAGMDLDYVVEDKPLGTGGAVCLAMTKSTHDHVFVLNGDTYLDLEVDLIDEHWAKRGNPIIVAKRVTDTARYGRLVVQEGLVSGFTEKGISGDGLINAGCYVFPRNQFEKIKLSTPWSLESDLLCNAVRTVPIDVFITNGHFIDIGVPEDYIRAQIELAEK